MCQRIAIVFLCAVIVWACSVSFGQPVRVERAYRAADGTFDEIYRWQDLRVSLLSARRTGTSDPTLTLIRNNAGSIGVWGNGFSGTQNDELVFSCQLPHGIDGSYIDAHVHWYSPTTVPAGQSIILGYEYVITGYGEVIASQSTILTQTLTTGYASNTHWITELGTIPIPSRHDSAVMVGRIYRTGVSDTFGDPIVLTDMDFHCQLRAVGSTQRYGDQ